MFEEILSMINNEKIEASDTQIKNKIKEYKEQFKKMDEGELCFYAEKYEDYSNDWDDWCIDYTDNNNLGYIITNAVEYAVKLVNYKNISIYFDHINDALFKLILILLKISSNFLDLNKEKNLHM